MAKARLRVRRKAPALLLRGSMTLPAAPQPQTDGMHVRVGTLLDAVLPGAGWTSKAKGRRWIFADRAGTHGGVVRVDLVRAAGDPKHVTFKIAAAVDSAAMTPGPLDATVWLGASGACATGGWNGPNGPAPRCAGRPGKIVCR
jgi:hypothetical protein